MAAKLRHAALSSMMENVVDGKLSLELVNSDALRLFKDSEDRAFGAPKQTAEVEHSGAMRVEEVRYTVVDPPTE